MKTHNQYLTINQLAKACSTSRASLIRMEQSGILTPAYIDPQNGYRYYDSVNVLRVIRINSLQELGITHREMKNYFDYSNNYVDLLSTLQDKLTIMEHMIGQIKLLLKQEPHLSISYYRFPGIYCYTHLMKNVTQLTSVRPQILPTINEAILQGFAIDKNVHPFVTVNHNEIIKNNFVNVGYDYEICIPVLPTKDSDNLKYFAPTQTISTILYGGAKDTPLAFEQLENEIERNRHTATGNARVIAAVNSYPGEDVPKEYWALQICIPFK